MNSNYKTSDFDDPQVDDKSARRKRTIDRPVVLSCLRVELNSNSDPLELTVLRLAMKAHCAQAKSARMITDKVTQVSFE